ncbi:unnamed protein product [Rotaria socialis]|uniref:Uncharacterized protein n=1 Tax=Rotaria socialis TaxID=392032 RepID=A0A820JB21_9BILA|nr:unnamed protein product [Rotaria socialis]CAF3495048.1 unnamed protein product [Rotaria socialis]CAF3579496.1 unnamed protein product [Rotaria socialis]CAF3579514.1 unnamed protein product [Rotaria socialis]CAF3725786.1 unnamed protein product [Rotaria socialis]
MVNAIDTPTDTLLNVSPQELPLAQIVESNPDNKTNQADQLTTQLTETVKIPEAAQNNVEDQRYQENSKILTELQERIERAELRATAAEPRIVSLEQDIRSAYVQMKSLIQSKETIRSKEGNYQNNIAELQARLQAAQQRSSEAEGDAGKMQHKIDQLQEKLAMERTKSSQTKH